MKSKKKGHAKCEQEAHDDENRKSQIVRAEGKAELRVGCTSRSEHRTRAKRTSSSFLRSQSRINRCTSILRRMSWYGVAWLRWMLTMTSPMISNFFQLMRVWPGSVKVRFPSSPDTRSRRCSGRKGIRGADVFFHASR